MTVSVLKNVKELHGFGVHHLYGEYPNFPEVMPFIMVDHDDQTLSFKIQNGPVKVVGINGCQVDCIVEAAIKMIEGFDAMAPCRENQMAIDGLKFALDAMAIRTMRRIKEQTEGTPVEKPIEDPVTVPAE